MLAVYMYMHVYTVFLKLLSVGLYTWIFAKTFIPLMSDDSGGGGRVGQLFAVTTAEAK